MSSDLVRMLLEKRGIVTDAEKEDFLSPQYEKHTHDPFLLSGMDVAVNRIFTAIERHEKIAIYADFDCDGIPGAAVLWDFFIKIGYDEVTVYLPHRDREGYGFHTEAIEKLAKQGVTLIITVDVGTTAIEPVARARELGVDVIITDHHEIIGPLPNAVAVINPKCAGYPFLHLCGAGVAYKVVQALLAEGRRRGMASFTAIPLGWEKWLLDLVAVATIADMVPLIGENRVLTYWGLRVLRKSPRPGMIALCNTARVPRATITENDIGFSFAPRINAASRMDSPDLAFRILTTQDEQEAERLAAELESLNASRKGIVGSIVREAKKRAMACFAPEDVVAVLGDTSWKPALLGLAANSLLEGRRGMVCLWGRDVNGNLKGSCRSDGTLSVVDVFSGTGDMFEAFGGHRASGGFTIKSEHVHAMQQAMNAIGLQLIENPGESPESVVMDAHISIRDVSHALLREVDVLAPFGVGNPKPIFGVRARVSAIKRFGKEKTSTEIMLCDDAGMSCRSFQFFKAPENFRRVPILGEEVLIAGTLERDTYRRSVALRISDILPG